mmetsp:Transcript_13841/g.20452  ORF Transcript_13841/g.20452 Transcript_13841/m.20452 type:complete len:84 (-) Transcript_13841:704-955(-)
MSSRTESKRERKLDRARVCKDAENRMEIHEAEAGDKSKMNMLKRSNTSSKPGRKAPKKNDSNMSDSDTIKHLNMYNNGKAIQN